MPTLEPIVVEGCGYGAARTDRASWPIKKRQQRNREMLYRTLNLRTTVAFVGAGASACFGHPDWKGLVEDVLKSVIKNMPDDSEAGCKQMEGLLAQIHEDDRPSDALLMFALGRVEQTLQCQHNGQTIQDVVAMMSRGRQDWPWDMVELEDSNNPMLALLDLRIWRYVTTNYDTELEYWAVRGSRPWANRCTESEPHLAWHGKDGEVRLADWPIFRDPMHTPNARYVQHLFSDADNPPGLPYFKAENSFTQLPEHNRKLAEFVLARRRDGEKSIFHCHGRCDDPASLIVTEGDYQSLYLNDGEASKLAYRQTISLLLGSNPILFVGYSLADEDLIRTLRIFSATEQRHKAGRPLFALFDCCEEKDKKACETKAEYFYLRYGVHVIWYGMSSEIDDAKADAAQVTLMEAEANVDIAKEKHQAATEFLEKPECDPKKAKAELRTSEEKLKTTEVINNTAKIKRKESEKTATEITAALRQTCDPKDADKRTRLLSLRLATALMGIDQQWRGWGASWLQKPMFREVSLGKFDNIYFHHELVGSTDDELAAGRVASDLATLCKGCGLSERKEDRQAGVVVLLGPGGSGKSHRAARLVKKQLGRNISKELKDAQKYLKKRFFWSSYFANDWTTGVDRAIAFLERHYNETNTRYDRCIGRYEKLEFLLSNVGALLVFDGFERLLRCTSDPEAGVTYASDVEQFLKLIKRYAATHSQEDAPTSPEPAHANRSTIVITSRLWPSLLGDRAAAEEELQCKWDSNEIRRRMKTSGTISKDTRLLIEQGIYLYRVKPLNSQDLDEGFVNSPKAPTLDSIQIAELCSLLNGHAYGLRLAQAYLSKGGIYEKLRRSLEHTPPDRRVSRMIAEAMDEYLNCSSKRKVGKQHKSKLARRFLERIAVFMSPINEETMQVCFKNAQDSLTAEDPILCFRIGTLTSLRKELIERHLLFKVKVVEDNSQRWTLHPLVRCYVFERWHHTPATIATEFSLPNFSLPGFTTGTTPVDPGPAGGKIVTGLLDALLEKAIKIGQDSKTNKCLQPARQLCRAAFGVMRSRMEATTAARWCAYKEYSRYSIRLLNTVKLLSGGRLWRHSDHPQSVSDPKGVLYPEELAWVYNELGLVCCCEGNMYDAIAVWTQGYAINRLVEHGESTGQFIVQSKLHFAHTYMELGQIGAAKQYLEETDQANHELKNGDFNGRIIGYRGLLAHLCGDIQTAQRCYRSAVRTLRSAGGNVRAESIFLRHWADLAIGLGDLELAEKNLRVSLSIAETGNHPDLEAFVRNSLGHLCRAQDRYNDARAHYEASKEVARRMGIRRLEADVLSELSRLSLDLGDAETARLRAMESISIANELGLGLRQCHGMVILGLASLMSGQHELGVGYLHVAHKLSRESGYWLRANEAEEHLRRVGEPVSATPSSTIFQRIEN